MAKLPDGMKMHRTTYGSTTYTYKGVHIGKYRDDYSLRAEYLSSNTGKFWTEYVYGTYRLVGVPALVDKYLADENYILDEATGSFKLTEARKAELIAGARQRTAEAITETEAKIIEAVSVKDWARVSSLTSHLLDYMRRVEWALDTEMVDA